MDFEMFTQKLKKQGQVIDVNLQNDSIVYLFKLLIDDVYANEIDFSRFSLKDISRVLELLENDHDFDEVNGLILFHIRQLDTAVSLSRLEVNLARNFLDVKNLQRKSKVTFI